MSRISPIAFSVAFLAATLVPFQAVQADDIIGTAYIYQQQGWIRSPIVPPLELRFFPNSTSTSVQEAWSTATYTETYTGTLVSISSDGVRSTSTSTTTITLRGLDIRPSFLCSVTPAAGGCPLTDSNGKISTTILPNFASATHTHTVTDVSGAVSINAIEGTGTATSTATDKLVQANDDRMSNARAPIGNIVCGSGLQCTSGTNTSTSTSVALSSTPQLTVNGVVESMMSFSNNTTGDSSASNHGFYPKLSGSVNDCARGDGTFRACTDIGMPTGWTTLYQEDFVSLNNQTISANGAVTIGSGSYYVVNYANATTFAVQQNGNGLYIRWKAASGNTSTAAGWYLLLGQFSTAIDKYNWTRIRAYFNFRPVLEDSGSSEQAFFGLGLSKASGMAYNVNRLAGGLNTSQASPSTLFTFGGAGMQYDGSTSWSSSYGIGYLSYTVMPSPASFCIMVQLEKGGLTAVVYRIPMTWDGSWPADSDLVVAGKAYLANALYVDNADTVVPAIGSWIYSGGSSGTADIGLAKLLVQYQ